MYDNQYAQSICAFLRAREREMREAGIPRFIADTLALVNARLVGEWESEREYGDDLARESERVYSRAREFGGVEYGEGAKAK